MAIEISALGARAGLVGAAELARRHADALGGNGAGRGAVDG
jgi:hypothetical protein